MSRTRFQLLLDLKLPKLSGAEVLARVTKKPGKRTNVVLISAAGSGDVREIAHAKEVNAILRKSFAIAHADVIFPALAALARACRPGTAGAGCSALGHVPGRFRRSRLRAAS